MPRSIPCRGSEGNGSMCPLLVHSIRIVLILIVVYSVRNTSHVSVTVYVLLYLVCRIHVCVLFVAVNRSSARGHPAPTTVVRALFSPWRDTISVVRNYDTEIVHRKAKSIGQGNNVVSSFWVWRAQRTYASNINTLRENNAPRIAYVCRATINSAAISPPSHPRHAVSLHFPIAPSW